MANTLTNLIPVLYTALDTVSREVVGLIPAVQFDSSLEGAALDETVRSPITADAGASAANTPAVTPPDTGDESTDSVAITISKSQHQAVRWSGEDERRLANGGIFQPWVRQRFEQKMRALVNEIELDLWTEIYQSSSRAFGAAGTTPFATAADMADFAGVLRVLEENGAKGQDLQLALGHAAIGNLRGKQSGLFKVNEAGREDLLRNGMTDRIMGMAIRHSDAIGIHTKGTGTSYVTNSTTTNAIGDTTIPVDTGTGTILAGDVVQLQTGGATYKYIVNTALSGGNIVLGKPGLQVAEADGNTVTIGANYTANLAFARSAVVLATRMPLMGDDLATDKETITDPISGLSFEIAQYKQFGQTAFHVRLAWGFKVVKEAHVATLLG